MNKINLYFKKNVWALALITFFTLIAIFSNWQLLTTPDDTRHYSDSFSQSQYVLGDASTAKVDDATVYVYAGHSYWKGEDPTIVNFEHPPLGKYVLGLSYILFKNSFILNVPLFFFIFLLTYELMKKFIKNKYLILSGLAILFACEILVVHVGLGLMDLQQVFYTLLFFNLLFWKTPKITIKYVLVGFCLALIASVKYPIIVVPLFIPILFLYAFINKRLRYLLLTFFTAGVTYLSIYLVYFTHNHTLLDFIKFEWFRYRWWTGDRTMPKFLIWQTLFTGKFKGWWAEGIYEYSPSWNLIWPFLTVASPISALIVKRNLQSLIIIYYSMGLFAMYSIGAAANERYVIQLFPFWILLVMMATELILKKYSHQPSSKKSLP